MKAKSFEKDDIKISKKIIDHPKKMLNILINFLIDINMKETASAIEKANAINVLERREKLTEVINREFNTINNGRI